MNKQQIAAAIKEHEDSLKSLRGKLEESGGRWRAEAGEETYWSVNSFADVDEVTDIDDSEDNFCYETRNYFKTKEEAVNHLELIRAKAELQDHVDELGEFKDGVSVYVYTDESIWHQETFRGGVTDKLMIPAGVIIPIDAGTRARSKRVTILENIVRLSA